jgi:hypothetical protein
MRWFRPRLGFPVVVAAAGIFAGVVNVRAAQMVTCRTDPVIRLSNGVTLRLFEDIRDTPRDVTGITYGLEVPAGVRITSISYSGPVPTDLQSVAVAQQDRPGNYEEYAYVQTRARHVTVTAYVTAGARRSARVVGRSNEMLHVHLTAH